MLKTKVQDKIPEEELNEVEISSLLIPDREFKVMIIKMFKELRRRLDEQSEKLEVFNKEFKNIKKNQTEMKNTMTETKNTLEGVNSILNDTEKQVSELEDRAVEITEAEQKKKKE